MPNVFQNLVSCKRVFRELKMLSFFKHENSKRISAKDALAHPYLDEGRLRYHTCMCACCYTTASGRVYTSDFEPVTDPKFDDGFEKNLSSVRRVKEIIHQFILEQQKGSRVPLCINPQSAAFKSFISNTLLLLALLESIRRGLNSGVPTSSIGPTDETVPVCPPEAAMRQLKGKPKKESSRDKKERKQTMQEARRQVATIVLPTLAVLVLLIVVFVYVATRPGDIE
ncbi:Serine/threonine-protein kinase NLK [Liparis tanakae]|uniref:Single-pass membrane and coiled-coil domain-containing protein 4 n=1 Tax=Liparis tanakae TaxID=230148 RepID=A0A4Z2EV28_9TELE|nr:Serine/threonine-protein kinase NLK [Liparis tanakae]